MQLPITSVRRAAASLAFAGVAFASALPAIAQVPYGPPPGPPPGAYGPQPYYRPYGERRELVGTVADFKPYRLLLADGGRTTRVDLDNRTTIAPLGTSLTPGMRVAILGHWSRGVFIARAIGLR